MLSNLTHKKEFQSTLPMRGATARRANWSRCVLISIHTPHAGSDTDGQPMVTPGKISIHTPHAGSDEIDFQPHSPLSISIHTPHAGSDFRPYAHCADIQISIHTPHAGSDGSICPYCLTLNISIHTPHAGSDNAVEGIDLGDKKFQSTLPMRGATRRSQQHPWSATNFNPHSPCGERPPFYAYDSTT